MKKYIPVATVLIAMLLLYNTIPKAITILMVFIIMVLVMSRWDILKQYFQ